MPSTRTDLDSLTNEVNSFLNEMPSPLNYEYAETLQTRELWLDSDVDIECNTIDVIKKIIHWNREDIGLSSKERKPIILYIFTMGGDLDLCYSIIDVIQASKTPVYTVAVGRVYSAGAYIFISGKKRFMLDNSQLLFHQGTGGVEGQFEEVQSRAEQYKNRVSGLTDLLRKHTSASKKYIKKNIKTEWYVGSDTAMDLGMCDKVIKSLSELFF